MLVREDANIGSVVVGDIYKKSTCAQLRLGDVIDALTTLRRTQLSLFYTAMGLQEPTDDIAEDVAVTHKLLGELHTSIQEHGRHNPKGFVAEVQDAMQLELPTYVPPSLQNLTGGPDSSTKDITESHKGVALTPVKTVSIDAPLSPDGLLCTMHAKSPCTPTDLNSRSTTGPWFQRTPTLSHTTGTSAISVTRRLELPPNPTLGREPELSSTERAGAKDLSCVSELVEEIGEKRAKRKVSSPPVDNSHDDVISKTTQQADGR